MHSDVSYDTEKRYVCWTSFPSFFPSYYPFYLDTGLGVLDTYNGIYRFSRNDYTYSILKILTL